MFFAVLLCLAACPAFASRPALTWERMHTAAQPSRLLLRLGLTHITRLGFTRDGAQKTDPDPLFPPSLTDVVPIDAEHVLLVRGTAAGRVAFRRRVAQQDVQMREPRWHVEASLGDAAPTAAPSPTPPPQTGVGQELSPPLSLSEGGGAGGRGSSAALDIPDAPAILTVPNSTGTRTYQLDVNDVPGSPDVIVTARPNLAASALPVAGLTLPAPPAVWGNPLTVRIRPGTMAVLSDNAVARDAARAKLKLPAPAVPEADVVLHVTVTPFAPVAPAPLTPATVLPAAP